MDSHQHLGYELLRLSSTPSSPLGSFSETGPGKVRPAAEGFEARKFGSRFMGFGSSNMLDEKLKESPAVSPRQYSGLPPQYPRPSSVFSSSAMEGSYGTVGSTAMDHHQSQPKLNSPNLAKLSSSSPGLSSHLSAQNGYAAVKGPGNYRVGSGFDGEISSANKWKGQFSFPSSVGMLPQISETGGQRLGEGGPDDSSRLGIGIGESRFSGPGFHFNSWSDSSHFSHSFSSTKRDLENDVKPFPRSQNGKLVNHGPLLSHHMSLPRSSSEMSAMERLLQVQQDPVPFKIRAKRGCATHPRSIAERVRRTRISERMRKLQELVPNMDKQTNTADMLDLAVEYIKDLQHQFKTLSDNLANCKCTNMQDSVASQLM